MASDPRPQVEQVYYHAEVLGYPGKVVVTKHHVVAVDEGEDPFCWLVPTCQYVPGCVHSYYPASVQSRIRPSTDSRYAPTREAALTKAQMDLRLELRQAHKKIDDLQADLHLVAMACLEEGLDG